MITQLYYVALLIGCFVALSNWKLAIYVAISLDFARDPVRKLDPGESVLITVSVLLLWGVITLSAFHQNRHRLHSIAWLNPLVLRAIQLVAFALVPGCVLSLLSYAGGYKLVALGVVSYLAPFAGILLGYLLVQDTENFQRVLRFYCIVNGLAMISVVAEYAGWDWPCLGGLRGMFWIRYSGEDIVNLIGGWYRSPDIMGLHAAQVVMFSAVLALQPRKFQIGWVLLSLFGCVCLLLGGRRKMLGMPLVFAACLIFFARRAGLEGFVAKLLSAVAGLAIVGGGYLLLTESTDDYVSREYLDYASTLFSEGTDRYGEIVGGSVRGTVQNSGFFGRGMGSATQGAHHIVGVHEGGWQEDGVSRIFNELGIPGAILMLMAGLSMAQAVLFALRTPQTHRFIKLLQLCLLCIVIANLASFTASHQQLSGDPASAILILIMLGGVFGLADLAKIGEGFERGGWGAMPAIHSPLAGDSAPIEQSFPK